jgi:TolB-like protein/DNA-binding winged helix-turn-helix (wHTH) protein
MSDDFRIGEWIVRPRRDLIERGDERVHVKPKAMAVLLHLAERPGETISRADLFDVVWPGSAVSDDVLTQCIVELRKAFHDPARHPHVIETIPKVGFRLLPPVAPVGPAPEPKAQSGHSRALLQGFSAVILLLVSVWTWQAFNPPYASPDRNDSAPSIAVLPFLYLGPDRERGWRADFLTEELIHRLAQIDGLQVSSRTASFHFKGGNEDLQTIVSTLDVRYVLEGSVRRAGDRLRITVQLISAEDGFHLWSRTFDTSEEQITGAFDEIAASVARSLSVELQIGQPGMRPGESDNAGQG